MHKFEKRDAKSRTLVILAVVGLAAAITVGIFTAVRLIRKPAQSKDDPKTGIVYDDSAVEGGWDNLSPEEIAEKLNEKVAEGMINISMNTAPYFENGTAEGNVMIVNESINNYPQQVEFIRNDTGEQIYQSKAIPVGSKIERAALDVELPAGTYECRICFSAMKHPKRTRRSPCGSRRFPSAARICLWKTLKKRSRTPSSPARLPRMRIRASQSMRSVCPASLMTKLSVGTLPSTLLRTNKICLK